MGETSYFSDWTSYSNDLIFPILLNGEKKILVKIVPPGLQGTILFEEEKNPMLLE